MRQSGNFIRWVITDQNLPFLIFQEKDSKYLIVIIQDFAILYKCIDIGNLFCIGPNCSVVSC